LFIIKSKEKKSHRDRLATKKVFSAVGGLQHLVDALAQSVGHEHIILQANNVIVTPVDGQWQVDYTTTAGEKMSLRCRKEITTVGAYALKAMLPFVKDSDMAPISALRYAPIVQASVGFSDAHGIENKAFGGLIPSCEQQQLLGILFPSACFSRRCPAQGALFSFFLGGVKHAEMLDKTDANFKQVTDILAKYRTEKGFQPYDKLSETDRKNLQAPINALAEDLAKLRGILGLN